MAKRVTIGDVVLQARRAVGLSQRALGELLGVSNHTVMRWELGKSGLTISKRMHLVGVIAARDSAVAQSLASSLGVPFGSGASTAGVVAPLDVDTRVALAVYASADLVDAPARRFREASLALLERLAREGITLDAARASLARLVAASKRAGVRIDVATA